jgi:hypothetical protein
MHGCGLVGFGADGVQGGVDPAAVAAMTFKDPFGITYWKPEVVNLIAAALPSLWVVSEQGSSQLANMPAVRMAFLGQRSDVPSTASEPVKAADWHQYSLSIGQSVLASYGLAWLGGGLQRYLFSIPDSAELLKQASGSLGPVLTLSQSAFAALNMQQQPYGGSGISAWWANRSTMQKVAIIGAGVVVVGGATGLVTWGKRRRKAHTILAL